MTHFPIRTDDEILIADEAHVGMEEMKLDKLREEDEIQRKPVSSPSMQMLFKQGPPLPVSREVSLRPSAVFLPPKPQPVPSWGDQVKITFRDISGMQKKQEVAFVNQFRQNDNWPRDASRVFQLPMNVIDERTSVETDDVLTCMSDYDADSIFVRVEVSIVVVNERDQYREDGSRFLEQCPEA
jgi:hypothetical protein